MSNKIEIVRKMPAIEESGYISITEIAIHYEVPRESVARSRLFENTFRKSGITYIPIDMKNHYNTTMLNELVWKLRYPNPMQRLTAQMSAAQALWNKFFEEGEK